MKKNERLIDVENQSEWMFLCKTRGPDIVKPNARPVMTWTYILRNQQGHRRFIPESKFAESFERKTS